MDHMDHGQMDHSQMDHSQMDHSHMDHSGHGGGDMCTMNMFLTFSTKNICLFLPQWRIDTPLQLLLSLMIIFAISAGYEYLRALTRTYGESVRKAVEGMPRHQGAALARRAHVTKAGLYAGQNFWAFMIMLLFMTYNIWVMAAVIAGSFAGYLFFAEEEGSAAKETACH